jgi:two-component system, NarL family, nitrate/nitrite response regulator NarL
MSDGGNESEGIRVAIIDDHKLFGEAIRGTLKRQGMNMVGLAISADEAYRMVRAERPDVILLDLGLPDEDGLSLGQRLLAEQPDLKIIVVTATSSERAVNEAIRGGFHGYLTKDTPVAQLPEAIRAVMDGRLVVSRGPAQVRAVGSGNEDRHVALLIQQLTSRELEVLEQLALGVSGSVIAERLHMSPNTVRTHVQSILAKLQVHSRLEAAAFAVRHQIVRPASSGGRGVPPYLIQMA